MFPNPAPGGRTDTLQLSYIPQMLAEYIQQKYIYSTETCSPTQRPEGAQTPSNCHISSKCWQNISNTNIFIQLTHVPQTSTRRAHRHPPNVIYPPSNCHMSGGPTVRGPIRLEPIRPLNFWRIIVPQFLHLSLGGG